jgi:hypothetical protein
MDLIGVRWPMIGEDRHQRRTADIARRYFPVRHNA